MNIDEAIKFLKSMQNPLEDYADMIGAPAGMHGIKYVYPDPEDYAIEEAIEVLKRAEKYKWHDLRKDPDDLPEIEHEVDVVCERRYTNGKRTQIRTHAFYEDGIMLENDSIWSWVNLEGEYNEEEDCHVIPEGWWEYRHYNPNDCYNGVIDDCVIAWREIEPFKEK